MSAGRAQPKAVAKVPSGISGLDEITRGGLPKGRATLVCGGPGSGKTMLAMEFLVRGATEHGEPGVFISFEESEEELVNNVAALGFDLRELIDAGKIFIDYVHIDRSEIEETGDYDLEGLFVRLKLAMDTVGSKRVVLDTMESLFSGFSQEAILRAEIRRLFRWLKDHGQTVVITAEKGQGSLTRYGIEEYVSDCVIFLDHRVHQQVSTRRLRVVKYRGSQHGTNEYPFLIDQHGIAILPETSLRLDHRVYDDRISTGIERMDDMLGGEGYYRGSSIMVSGTAGTGKTTVSAALVNAACERGERALYLAHEESAAQLIRNMRSVGMDLQSHVDRGLLRIKAVRPVAMGLEMHLVALHREVETFGPSVVVVDPITNLIAMGTARETQSMVTRLIDYLKERGITTLLTSLTSGGAFEEQSGVAISSLVDTWLVLSVVRSGGERNRTLTIVKSRGMQHSNQSTEFILSPNGLQLVDTYLGPSGVLTGSARIAQEAQDAAEVSSIMAAIERAELQREHRRRLVEAQISALQEDFAAQDAELERSLAQERLRLEQWRRERSAMAKSRGAFGNGDGGPSRRST